MLLRRPVCAVGGLRAGARAIPGTGRPSLGVEDSQDAGPKWTAGELDGGDLLVQRVIGDDVVHAVDLIPSTKGSETGIEFSFPR